MSTLYLKKSEKKLIHVSNIGRTSLVGSAICRGHYTVQINNDITLDAPLSAREDRPRAHLENMRETVQKQYPRICVKL